MIVLDIHLPKFLMQGFQYVGNLTTPLSLIFIGIEISKLNWSDLHLESDLLSGIVGRFIFLSSKRARSYSANIYYRYFS